jgi:hypothetical protein
MRRFTWGYTGIRDKVEIAHDARSRPRHLVGVADRVAVVHVFAAVEAPFSLSSR